MDYSVLVVSCDRNAKLLDCFFKYFNRFYDARETKVYLSMEKLLYKGEETDIKVFHDQDSKYWSQRLKKALERIDTKAVLLLLDDFIIESKADMEEIERLAALITNDDRIAHFALTTVPMKNDSDKIYFGKFYKRHRFGRYKVTLQAGIWNREELISILNENESAWSTEIFANIRTYLSNRDYYALIDQKLKPIDYNDGFFCLQGKQNEEEVLRLEQKFGESFRIEGFESNNGIIIRDNISFGKRILRRIKIILYGMMYYARYWRTKLGKKD